MPDQNDSTGPDRRELLRRGAALGAAGAAVWAAPAILTTSAAAAATAPATNCVDVEITCTTDEVHLTVHNGCSIAIVEGSLGVVFQPAASDSIVLPANAIINMTFFAADAQGQPVGLPISTVTVRCP